MIEGMKSITETLTITQPVQKESNRINPFTGQGIKAKINGKVIKDIVSMDILNGKVRSVSYIDDQGRKQWAHGKDVKITIGK